MPSRLGLLCSLVPLGGLLIFETCIEDDQNGNTVLLFKCIIQMGGLYFVLDCQLLLDLSIYNDILIMPEIAYIFPF